MALLEQHDGPDDLLTAARSWLAMLGPDPDPDLADLFAEFARLDREMWLRAGSGG